MRENIIDTLNSAQKEAVECLLGPSLIIAGAGSGKTRVLTSKVANILCHNYDPSSIMVLTFTNKAAAEMKTRIAQLIGDRLAYRLFAGTFHSVFLKFLIQYAEVLGYSQTFTIYDKDDSKTLVKRCIKELGLDDKIYKPNEISSRISECKNNLITSNSYTSYIELMESDKKTKRGRLHEVFSLYTQRCREQNIMDFDDILLNTYKLVDIFPNEFAKIRDRFNFILVDEYQDTNRLQYLILRALAEKHKNITVVGDDAQSIYAFRGARIENILSFQKDYPNANVFRLEQNYRSTQNIVDAANSLIKHNKGQLSKECYSERISGEKIELISAYAEKEEATLVASSIISQIHKDKLKYEDFAILYRTNSQSRVIEEALRGKNLPFKIYGGRSFYDRAEIKSLVAYLRLVINDKDDEAFKRVINFPSRGIGATSMEKIISLASEKGLSICELVNLINDNEIGIRPATLLKVRSFVKSVERIRVMIYQLDAYEIAKLIDEEFQITASLKEDKSLEGQTRYEYALEFFNSIKGFVDEGVRELLKEGEVIDAEAPLITLDLYLQNIALISTADLAQQSSDITKPLDKEEENNKISLMTVHAAKGLEFPYVYVVGMEENLFPSGGLYLSSQKDIEEERRLFYVALTRAKECVKLSFAAQRLQYGNYQRNEPSRFLKEIPKEYIKNPDVIKERTSLNFVHAYNFAERNVRREDRREDQREYKPIRKDNFIPDSPVNMKVGQRIEHERFGIGVIKAMMGEAESKKAIVEFQSGEKTLMLKFAKMKILDN